ncbi:hypothetical protein [Mesorhizobium sp.]|uniref:hypothetical protein n=1 Tax=Mesorhizobium sp. TaxID=1871066 RepID=UPI00257A55D3|nr:hypothetical protein [Mesorhizobium sp.]
MIPTYRSFDGGMGSTRANSVSAGGIDLRQARSGLDYAPLRSSYPAAQCDIDANAAVLLQHLVRTLKRALGSVKPLSGSRQFHVKKFHYPESVAVPSIGKPRVVAVGSGCSRARSSDLDVAGTVMEREWWRRWPEGRDE